jgi:hypothetical protein
MGQHGLLHNEWRQPTLPGFEDVMGANQNNRSKSGAGDSPKAYTGARGRTTGAGNAGPALWGMCDPAKLQTAIARCAGRGAALLCGVTRDGGSATVTLFYGEERVRMYPRTDGELDVLLDDLIAWGLDVTLELSWWL